MVIQSVMMSYPTAENGAGKLWRDTPDALPLSYRRVCDESASNRRPSGYM